MEKVVTTQTCILKSLQDGSLEGRIAKALTDLTKSAEKMLGTEEGKQFIHNCKPLAEFAYESPAAFLKVIKQLFSWIKKAFVSDVAKIIGFAVVSISAIAAIVCLSYYIPWATVFSWVLEALPMLIALYEDESACVEN